MASKEEPAADGAPVDFLHEPQLLFSLAHSLSASCVSGNVSQAVATALRTLFPAASHLAMQLAPVPGYCLTVKLDREGHASPTTLHRVLSLASLCHAARAPVCAGR